MANVIRFHGKQFIQGFEKATATGLLRAGAFYHTACQRAVSVPNSGVRVRRKRDTSRGKAGSTFTIYPRPSKPGEPPRLRTGFGRKSIVRNWSGWKTKDPWVRVGVTRNGIYMFFLETGTRTIARRPWLTAVLMKYRTQIGNLALRGAKKEMP